MQGQNKLFTNFWNIICEKDYEMSELQNVLECYCFSHMAQEKNRTILLEAVKSAKLSLSFYNIHMFKKQSTRNSNRKGTDVYSKKSLRVQTISSSYYKKTEQKIL